MLVYNLYSSNATTPETENTDLAITNTNNATAVTVHWFFVRNTGQVVDYFMTLVPNQTASLLASAADPGATGYVIVTAIDATTGAPISFNYLTGEASVKLASGHFANLPAQAFAALYSGTLPGLVGGATAATLNFDGTVYNRVPRSLQIDHLASTGDGNSAMLIVNRLGGSLVTGGSGVNIGSLSGVVYDPPGNPAAFNFSGGAQFKGIFGQNNFPRTSPNYNQFVPTGSYAWTKFYPATDVGVLGAVINFNPNALFNQGAFNFGHNLQAVTLTSATLEIPVTLPTATTTTTAVNSSAPASTYGSPVTFTATVSSSAGTPTGTVEFFAGATSLGASTLSGGSATLTLSTLNAISHSITAVYSGAPNFFGSTSAIFTQTVNKATLTVTADNKTKVYGTVNPAFTATITGFVNGETASVVSGSPALSTTATSGSGVSSYPITVAIGTLSATNYTFTFVNGTLTVTKATLTVTADNKTKVYGAVLPALTATITGFVNGDTAAVISGAPNLTTTATSGSAVSSYPITVAPGTLAAINYDFTLVNGTLTVTQATLTITADNKTKVYGAANPALTATISGFVNGDTISVVSGTPALSTTATTGSAVNSYLITAAVGTLSTTNYTFTFVSGTLTVTQATLTVTADNKTKTYGTANPVLTASFSGFVNSDTASVVSGAPSLTTTATTNSSVTSYPITVAIGTLTATNYTFTFINGTLTVTKATLTVTADNKAKAFGAALPPLTATITGFVNGDTAAAISGAPSLTTTATSGSAAGGYPISAAIGTLSAASYTFNFVNGALTVSPVSLLVTADNKTKVFGAPLPNFTAMFTGLVNGDTPATIGGGLNFNTSATATSVVGNYPITPGGVSSSNYTISFANGTLAITKAGTSTVVQSSAATIDPGQLVTFTATVNVVAPGAGAPTGTVTFTDGATVIGSGTLNAARQATVTTATLPSGTRSITATYAGDGSFTGSASPVFSEVVNNTLVGSNVTVQNTAGSSSVTTTFTNVTAKGNTTVTPLPSSSTPPLPTGFTVAGDGTLSFEVQTTATFSGPITICFNVPSVNNPTDFANLKVLHGEGGVLVDRTSSHDFASRTVCALVSSLSPFVIALNNATPVGPGDPAQPAAAASDTKAGSVLVFNFYSSSLTNPAHENTRINLTNTSVDFSAYIHLFFVDGSNCSVADSYICLTPNQTTALLASDLDPGVSGYVIAVAVDKQTGCPINFNYLIGDEYIKLTSGHTANLTAVAFAALSAPVCSAISTTATLNFDNVSYNAVPRVLAVDSISSLLDNNSRLLVINRISGSLLSNADPIGSMFGLFYDDQENPYSFSFTAGCQLRQTLSNTFPRTTPRLNILIPNGRSGWMKVQASADAGILGATLNFNPNAAANQNAFTQGHNLHALTLTTRASLIIPVHPPACP